MILAVFVMAISAYCFITKDYLYAPISSLLLGILIAIIGIDEFKNNGKNSRCMFLYQYLYWLLSWFYLVSNYI